MTPLLRHTWDVGTYFGIYENKRLLATLCYQLYVSEGVILTELWENRPSSNQLYSFTDLAITRDLDQSRRRIQHQNRSKNQKRHEKNKRKCMRENSESNERTGGIRITNHVTWGKANVEICFILTGDLDKSTLLWLSIIQVMKTNRDIIFNDILTSHRIWWMA